jgi:hypothetical protein
MTKLQDEIKKDKDEKLHWTKKQLKSLDKIFVNKNTHKCNVCKRRTMKWKDYHFVCSNCGHTEKSEYS